MLWSTHNSESALPDGVLALPHHHNPKRCAHTKRNTATANQPKSGSIQQHHCNGKRQSRYQSADQKHAIQGQSASRRTASRRTASHELFGGRPAAAVVVDDVVLVGLAVVFVGVKRQRCRSRAAAADAGAGPAAFGHQEEEDEEAQAGVGALASCLCCFVALLCCAFHHRLRSHACCLPPLTACTHWGTVESPSRKH